MSDSKRLWDAVDRISSNPDDWEQGTDLILWNGPKRCLIGHVLGDDLKERNDTCYTDYAELPEADIITSVIQSQYPDRLLDMYATRNTESIAFTFNDHSDTTVEDVVRVLEKAAIQIDETV